MANQKKHVMQSIDERGLKLPITLGIFALFAFYFLGHRLSVNNVLSNIMIYILSVVLFLAVVGISALILGAADCGGHLRDPRERAKKLAAALLIPVGGIFLLCCFLSELKGVYVFPGSYFRHRIPAWLYFLMIIPCILFSFSAIRSSAKKSTLRRYLLFVTIAFLQGMFLCSPNPFLDDIYHIDAYTTSIINTLAGAPFEAYSSSIYGHYGLLYFLPVNVLRHLGMSSWMAVSLTIGIFGFITFFCEYWCMNQVIKNDAVFTIAVLANAIVSFQVFTTQYYQMMPHRYIFQAIVLSGCIIAYRRPNSVFVRFVMWVIAALSMVWNLEVGLIVTAVWSLASVCLDARNQNSYRVGSIVKVIFCSAAAFLVGYAVVNGYNLIVGGNPISILTYIYPFCSGTYQVGMLELALETPDNGYFIVIAVMLGVFGLYFLDALHIHINETQYICILAAVMGLGVFTYYMNRTVSPNATIITFTLVILLAHLCDRFVPFITSSETKAWQQLWAVLKIRNVVGFYCMVILVAMALASVSTFGATFKNKLETAMNSESLADFIDEAYLAIPYPSVAFGKGTAQLYALMDRGTGIYIADWEDIGTELDGTFLMQEALDKLTEILEENEFEYIVTCEDVSFFLPQNQYKMIDTLNYDTISFKIFERQDTGDP